MPRLRPINTAGSTVAAILLVAATLYAFSYSLLSKRSPFLDGSRSRVRMFRSGWQARLFAPALKIEELMEGEKLWSGYDSHLPAKRMRPATTMRRSQRMRAGPDDSKIAPAVR